VAILIPIYEDWEALLALLPRLGDALGSDAAAIDLVIVDDGSQQFGDVWALGAAGTAFHSIELLRLRRNLGHQRAIAVGLSRIARTRPEAIVVVMDGDGEDDPADVPRLLSECARHDHRFVVFAERTKRSESRLFQLAYHAYRHLHRLLTGIPVRVGNFSAVPPRCLDPLLVAPELWNHYAAAVLKTKVPRVSIATVRRRRLSGGSTMNIVALAMHGLSAISVFAETVGVRLIAAIAGLTVLVVTGLLLLFASLAVSEPTLPQWSLIVGLASLVLLAQAWAFAALLAFLILSGRQSSPFLPVRDCDAYIQGSMRIAADREAVVGFGEETRAARESERRDHPRRGA
jgi:hypothetical protein